MPLRHFGFLVPAAPASDRAWFPPGDTPTVLVGLSTTHHHQTELLQMIVAVLGEMPVRALVTTAGVVDTGSWRRPSNVAIVDYVPHASVMDQTDVMVNHAGLGSVATALSFSVPMVCIPDGRDQPLNAARVAELGAGLVLNAECSAHEIRRAIEEIVAGPDYRNAAASIAEASRLEGGPDVAATALVAMA
jgi:MGT family glycosyltransferase